MKSEVWVTFGNRSVRIMSGSVESCKDKCREITSEGRAECYCRVWMGSNWNDYTTLTYKVK